MFVDFNKTFKGKSLSEKEIPDLVVKKLSESLPEGFKYVAGKKDGSVRIVSESGEVTLSNFEVNVPDDFKAVLNEDENNSFPRTWFQLSYNAQRPLELQPTHPGYLTLNGKEIPMGEIHRDIFHKTEIQGTKLMAYPAKFTESFECRVSTSDGKYMRNLKFSRKPLLSLTDRCFQSEEEQPFQMKFISSDAGDEIKKLTITLELKYAQSIQDIAESVFIYNDFADGKAKMNGYSIQRCNSKKEEDKYSPQAAEFWQKILHIEKYLDIHFMPPDGNINLHDICEVELLYRNLICNEPMREYGKMTSITVDPKNFNDEDMENAKKEQYDFQFHSQRKFILFGNKFSLPVICMLFNTAIKNMVSQESGKIKLEFKDVSTDKPAYTSVLCFKDQDELDKFFSSAGGNISSIFVNAKLAAETIQADFNGRLG